MCTLSIENSSHKYAVIKWADEEKSDDWTMITQYWNNYNLNRKSTLFSERWSIHQHFDMCLGFQTGPYKYSFSFQYGLSRNSWNKKQTNKYKCKQRKKHIYKQTEERSGVINSLINQRNQKTKQKPVYTKFTMILTSIFSFSYLLSIDNNLLLPLFLNK